MTTPVLRRTFPPTPGAVREARAFLRASLLELTTHLDGAGRTAGVIDLTATLDVETVVMAANEVVSNAVLHGRTDFEVRVGAQGRTVRVEVVDANPRVPQPCLAPDTATSGRGLAMVDGSGLRWGVDREHDGKTVWLEAPVDAGAGCR